MLTQKQEKMEKLHVKITSSEPFDWYVNDEDIEVTEIETEMSFTDLLDEIAHEGYATEEMMDEPRTFEITFPNGETITWKVY